MVQHHGSHNNILIARKDIQKLKGDCCSGFKIRAQAHRFKNTQKLQSLFKSERNIKTAIAHSIYRDDHRRKQGGTYIILFDQLVNLLY